MPEVSLIVKSPKVTLPGLDDAIERLQRLDALLDMLGRRKEVTIALKVTGDEGLQVVAANVQTLATALRDLGHATVGDNLAKGLVSPGEAAKFAAREVENLQVQFKRLNDIAVSSQASFLTKREQFVTSGQMQVHDQQARAVAKAMEMRDAALGQLQSMQRAAGMASTLAGGPVGGPVPAHPGAAPAIAATAAAEKELTPVAMAAAQALERQMEIVLAKTRAMASLTTATERVAAADRDAAKAATDNAMANVRAGVLTEKVIKDKKGKVVDTITTERTGPGRTLTTRAAGSETGFNTTQVFERDFQAHDTDFRGRQADLAGKGFLPGSPEQVALLRQDAEARGKIVERMQEQALGEERLAHAQRERVAADLKAAAVHTEKGRLRTDKEQETGREHYQRELDRQHIDEEALAQQKLNAQIKDHAAAIEQNFEKERALARSEDDLAAALRRRAQAMRDLQAAGTAAGGDEELLRGLGVRAERHEASAAQSSEKGRLRTVREQEAAAVEAATEAERHLNAALKDQAAIIERNFEAARGAARGGWEMAQALRQRAEAMRQLARSVPPPLPGASPVASADFVRSMETRAARFDATAERLEAQAARRRGVTSTGGTGLGLLGGFASKIGTAATWIGAYAVISRVTGALAHGVESALAYEHQFARLQAVFRGTNEDAKALGNNVLKLAADTGRGGDEAVDAAIRWARLGFTQEQAMEAVNVSLKTANVAEMTAAESAERLAAIYATYHLQVSDLSGVLNQLNTVSNSLNVTNKDLLNGIARTGAIAQQAGVPLSELIGLIGTGVARTGRPGAEIGNALKRSISAFYKPELQDQLSKGFGFEVKTPLGDLKNASQILGELYERLQKFDSSRQGELLGKIGGAQQISRLQAVMDGYVQAQVKAIQAQRDLTSADRENALIRGTAVSQMQSLTTEFTRLFSAMLNVGGEQSAISTLGKMAFILSKITGAAADGAEGGASGLGAKLAKLPLLLSPQGIGVLANLMQLQWLYEKLGGGAEAAQSGAAQKLAGLRSLGGAAATAEQLSVRLARSIGDTAARNPKEARSSIESYGDIAGPETARQLSVLLAQNRIEEIQAVLLARGNQFHQERLNLLEQERRQSSELIALKQRDAGLLREQIGGAAGDTAGLEKKLAGLMEEIAQLKGASTRRLLGDLPDEGEGFDPLATVKEHFASGLTDKTDALRQLFESGVGSTETDKVGRRQQATDAERAYVERIAAGREAARPTGDGGYVNEQEEFVGQMTTAQEQLNMAIDDEVAKRRIALGIEDGKLATLREVARLQDAIAEGVDSGKNVLTAGAIGQNDTEQMLAQLKTARSGIGNALPGAMGIGGVDNPATAESVARAQGEMIAYGNRLLEIRTGFAARQAQLEAEIANERERQNREASKALTLAGREDQLRAALLAKFVEQNGAIGNAQFQFLDKDTREAAVKFVPGALPAKFPTKAGDDQKELDLNRGAIDGLRREIEPLLKTIRDNANPAALLERAGPPPPPTITLPSLTINLSNQAEQIARSFAAITEGRIAAQLTEMQSVINRFIGQQRFATAQQAGAGTLNS